MGTVVSVKVHVSRLCYDHSANIQFSFFTTALPYTLNMRRSFSTSGPLEVTHELDLVVVFAHRRIPRRMV